MQDLIRPINFDSLYQSLNRTQLDNAVPPLSPPLWGDIEGVPFINVKGLSSYWKHDGMLGYQKQIQDVITGLHGQGEDYYFLIYCQNNIHSIYLGVGSRKEKIDFISLLSGAFPGIVLDHHEEIDLGRYLENEDFFRFRGRVTGVPVALDDQISNGATQRRNNYQSLHSWSASIQNYSGLERIVRGMQGTEWGYFIHAIPCQQKLVNQMINDLFETMNDVHSQTHLQVQKLVQKTSKLNDITQQGETTSLSGEKINHQAEYIMKNLEMELARYRNAQTVGGWLVDIHFFSPDNASLLRLQSLIRSVFHSGVQATEPLRTFVCQRSETSRTEDFSTFLSSSEIAQIAYLPHEEIPGYQIKDFTYFDVDFSTNDDSKSVNLGNILEYERDTKIPYNIPIETLNQHVLVSGITGSGKTTTIQHILTNLNLLHPSTPFLVIEPTKSEYRTLIRNKNTNGVEVYTLGDETVTPFRINPFQFEILDDEYYIQPQTHIDYLKAVFSAAFVLYPPMPYVLEICLHEIYTDRGWNLSTNRNDRLPEQHWGEASKWPIFPTMTDLYEKIDEVTERLGYDDQIKMDIIASLQTRLQSMMVGGKGLMLNIPNDKGMESLLKKSCILELERIGDDEQKIFIMGLLLTRLFEYRRLQHDREKTDQELNHVTVIEEAHRLIKAVSPNPTPDQPNLRGQAIETFSNIVSEIRAYGEGIIISEQIPTKLAMDAIKNTSLKIMHRLVSKDDRDLLSAMTNMNDGQSQYMVMMPKGQTIVFNQGDDHPFLVKIKPDEILVNKEYPSDSEIKLLSEANAGGIENDNFFSRSTSSPLNKKIALFSSDISTTIEFHNSWRSGHLHLWLPQLDKYRVMDGIIKQIQQEFGVRSEEIPNSLLRSIQRISWNDSYARGKLIGWNYEQIEKFNTLRLETIDSLMGNQNEKFNISATNLSNLYTQFTSRAIGPYEGCAYCKTPCLYRYDLLPLLGKNFVYLNELEYILRDTSTINIICTSIINASVNALQIYLNIDELPPMPELTICITSQGLKLLRLSPFIQRKVMNQISAQLITKGELS